MCWHNTMLFKIGLLLAMLMFNVDILISGTILENGQIKGENTPIAIVDNKEYVLGMFFKANWFRASQFCRYHGMQLASVSSQQQNDAVVNLIQAFGLRNEVFWTSGNDLSNAGEFFWMGNGQPFYFVNWHSGEPNNIGGERCVSFWNREQQGGELKWNNSFCDTLSYFVCERQV